MLVAAPRLDRAPAHTEEDTEATELFLLPSELTC